jgi:hypothetical protein
MVQSVRLQARCKQQKEFIYLMPEPRTQEHMFNNTIRLSVYAVLTYSNFYLVSNYRLFIKATINGTERNQMLVSSRAFDDAMIEILFAGDIDGDNIPDLIINTSYHYNAIVPTLYLSKPAGDKEILKVMGWHVSVGC